MMVMPTPVRHATPANAIGSRGLDFGLGLGKTFKPQLSHSVARTGSGAIQRTQASGDISNTLSLSSGLETP
jgi:hypothetical protein